MNEKINTIKNLAIGIPLFLGGIASKNLLKLDITGGIGDSLLSSEIDRFDFLKLWELKRQNPNNLNHDVVKLSEHALKLTITIGIKKVYEDDKKDGIGRKLTKEENATIDTAIAKYSSNISDKDAVQFVDFKNTDNPLGELINNIANDLPIISDTKPFNDFFKNHFEEFFRIYFGELLKKSDYHKALIAYNREIQGLMFQKIEEIKQNNNLPENVIDEIRKKINELTPDSLIESLDEINKNISIQLTETQENITQYFQTRKFILREINHDTLYVEFQYNKPETVANNYNALQEKIADKYDYFEYNSRLYSIDELNEQTFDYLAGKIKVNQLFTKRIIEAIKSDCAPQHAKFYGYIEQEGESWDTMPRYCVGGMQIISESFIGIVGEQLHKLFAIGKESGVEDKYVKKCRYIVKRTIDLTIFAFLSQLWDDVYKQKLILANKNLLHGLFTMNLEMTERIALLRRLIDIYKEQKMNSDMLFIADVLAISDHFEENSELYSACIELENLSKNLTVLDCYFAEKYLTVFCESFRFLVNYRIASMKKIEYFNIKNINEGYLHHYVNAGYKSKEEDKRNFDCCTEMVNSLFTNAVLLYKGDNYKQNINLFPFVIDYNALILEKNSKIAFFKQEGFNENELEYAFLDMDENFKLKYRGIAQEKGDKNVVFLTDEDLKVYNRDCVFDTFREIQKKLF